MRLSDCQQVVLEPDGTLSAVRRDVEQQNLQELAYQEPGSAGGDAGPRRAR